VSVPTGSKVGYIKPQTFMNESGKAVSAAKKEFEFKLESLLVVHDDLDLPAGDWKMQLGRGSAGHNGVKNVIEELGTKDFWRLRVGVGKPDKAGDKYVLEEPSKEDRNLIEKAIAEALPRVLEWVSS
ncbi:MAG: aminoacyl-tRNA hydrolase, partial [Patescibacteria group bacterium]